MSAGYWVRDGVEVMRKTTVVSLVPARFEAYGRVLYPVQSVDDGGHTRWLRWSDIARVTGAMAHPSMELETMLEFAPKGYFQSAPIVPEWRSPCGDAAIVNEASSCSNRRCKSTSK